MSTRAIDVVLDALRANDKTVIERGGDRWAAQCPSHDDRNPSLSIGPRRDGDGVVLCCHAECEPRDVLEAIGLTMRDLFDEPRMRAAFAPRNTYSYSDGRRVHRKPGKQFHQSGNTKGTALFGAERIGDACLVYVAEGEKDVLAIEAAGGTAVCSAMGAGKAHLADWSPLRALDVIVVADRDEAGLKHATEIVALLSGVAHSGRVVAAKAGKDAADHIAAGYTLTEFIDADWWTPVDEQQRDGQGAHDTRRERQPPHRKPPPVQPVSLDDALDVFGRWLHLDDTGPVLATAATVVANLAEGDPVWLLLVGPPSGGKTEILSSLTGLPYIIPTATITEASLLSGTPKRDRAKDATGGLLRQIGDFGILLAKDFTSVLAQNRDTAKQAMSAMREIYDGRWDRPIGTDGGKVLHWEGKCGFIGGVTPSYDRYGSIVNTLGDRYLLLRLPNVDAAKQACAALAQAEHEKQMRAELAEAMTGLIVGADCGRVHKPISDDDTAKLVQLASFAASARTIVERDGYSGELLVLPQPEGPARLVKALRRFYGALAALGTDNDTRWHILTRITIDCAPAVRIPVMRELLAQRELFAATQQPQRTATIAADVGLVTKTASRILDDLALLGIAERTKHTNANNSPDLWTASDWLHKHWPQK